ncbi:MAG: hypothetical protein AAFZ07_22205 [Actinomycetota bacterium]
MGFKDFFSDAKDWVEETADDIDDWVDDQVEGTPLAQMWEQAQDSAWNYIEQEVGTSAEVAADLWHDRTDEAIRTVGGYVEEQVEDTWAEDYVSGAGRVISAIDGGPEAVGKLINQEIGEQAEGTWAQGIWGMASPIAGGLITGGADAVGGRLEGTWLGEAFEEVAHVAEVVGEDDADATQQSGDAEAAAAEGAATEQAPTLADAAADRGIVNEMILRPAVEPPTDQGFAEAIEGRGIVNEMIFRPAVEPPGEDIFTVVRPLDVEPIQVEGAAGEAIDLSEVFEQAAPATAAEVAAPAPLGDAIPEVAAIPDAAAAPATEAAIPEVAAPAPPAEAAIPEVAAPAAVVAEQPAVEAPPAPEPTTFEASVAAADQAETAVDDMFTDLG